MFTRTELLLLKGASSRVDGPRRGMNDLRGKISRIKASHKLVEKGLVVIHFSKQGQHMIAKDIELTEEGWKVAPQK